MISDFSSQNNFKIMRKFKTYTSLANDAAKSGFLFAQKLASNVSSAKAWSLSARLAFLSLNSSSHESSFLGCENLREGLNGSNLAMVENWNDEIQTYLLRKFSDLCVHIKMFVCLCGCVYVFVVFLQFFL